MNTTKELVGLVELLPQSERNAIRETVFTHLERAEYHFVHGRSAHDDQSFTDTIYRTNHAYEGVLREAYAFHSKKESTNLETYKIEEYFEKEKVFSNRVKNLFMQYRKEWRNPSTHDHRIFFGEDEAFLAILSVSGFIFVLINQMIQIASYNISKARFVATGSITIYSSLFTKIVDKLTDFPVQSKSIDDLNHEVQLMGVVLAYLEKQHEGIEIKSDFLVPNQERLRPDFVVFEDKVPSFVIEMKIARTSRSLFSGIEQLFVYIETMQIDKGILFLFPPGLDEKLETHEIVRDERKIVVVGKKEHLTLIST